MKAYWTTLAARVDALTLRERVQAFAAVAAVIVFLAHFFVLGELDRRQNALAAQIARQQNNIAGIDAEVAQVLQVYQRDPDAQARERLSQVRAEATALGDSLRSMQRGLVPPERMAPLVESILRAHGRLQLVSLRTLPSAPVGAGDDANKPAVAVAASAGEGTPSPAAAVPTELLYRHGAEVVLRGNYLDMVAYMEALESMPTGLFWGSADLAVETWPTARLTLTLHTLSLDPKWMKL